MHIFSAGSFSLIVLYILLFSNVSFADEPTELHPVSVQINWHHQYQFAGFYAAIAKGYYEQAGLDVTIRSWQPGINIREEVVSGRATFGTAYSSVIADYIKGQPIKAVMTSFQYSPMVLLSKQPISNFQQLSGKTVSHYDNLPVLALLNRAKPDLKEPTRTLPPTGNIDDFIEGRIDLYGAYETNEPYQLDELGETYYLVKPGDFGISSAEDIVIVSHDFALNHPDIVDSFRQGTIAGWQYAIEHQEEIVDYIMEHYPMVKSRQALLYEAEATTKYVRTGAVPIGSLDTARLLATAAEARDIGLITAREFQRFQPEEMMAEGIRKSNLTQAEMLYLVENPVIFIGNDINWPPFEYINDQGQFSGIVADYLALFEDRLGVTFEPVTDKSWSTVVEMVKDRQLDMFSAATPTPERQTYLNFTDSYLTFPMVLVGQPTTLFINDYQELNGQSVAVVRDYWSHEYLRTYYPDIDLVLVENVAEGLRAVVNGEALVYSGNLAVINYTQQQLGISGLQIVGQSDQRFELAMGVHHDNPLLLSILQKTLDSITPEEQSQIYTNWISLELVTRLDQRQILHIGLIVLGVLALMFAWAMTYRFQKSRLQSYINQVHNLTFATTLNPKTGQILWASSGYCQLTGYTEEELQRPNAGDELSLDIDTTFYQQLLKRLQQGKPWVCEREGISKTHQRYWVELRLSPQQNWFGSIHKILATRVDITDKKRVEELSIQDDLTHLYNRRYLNQIFSSEVRRAQRNYQSVCFALVDLDYFKQINDTYGHIAGDKALIQVAELCKKLFNRGNDTLFRIGGEEFLIMTQDMTAVAFAQHLKSLKQALIDLKIENKHTDYGILTLSVGAGSWPAHQIKDFAEIYAQLDHALYLAKHQGRNQIVMI